MAKPPKPAPEDAVPVADQPVTSPESAASRPVDAGGATGASDTTAASPEQALRYAVSAASGTVVIPDPIRLELERRWFAVSGPVLHDGEALRENDAAFLTQPQFDALLRAGAIDAGTVWLDGELDDNEG